MLGGYRRFIVHAKTDHNKTVRDYKLQHKNLTIKDEVRHDCKLCSKGIQYTWDCLQGHLKLNHGAMKVSQYFQSYLTREEIKNGKILNEKYTRKKIMKAKNDGETKTTAKITETRSPQLSSRYSSRPHDYCIYSCEDCNFAGTHISSFFFKLIHSIYDNKFAAFLYFSFLLFIFAIQKKL